MNEIGEVLKKNCFRDFAHFVESNISHQPKRNYAAPFVEKLMESFPPLQDVAIYKGRLVYIGKKAQLIAGDLSRRFKTRDYRFDFADLDKLTIFSDNVIPAVLRKLNILDLIDKDLERAISSCQSLPAGSEQEIELRLCAIHACSLIVQNARRQGLDLKEMDLDYYLWLKGKDRGFREFERHYTKDTYFY